MPTSPFPTVAQGDAAKVVRFDAIVDFAIGVKGRNGVDAEEMQCEESPSRAVVGSEDDEKPVLGGPMYL